MNIETLPPEIWLKIPLPFMPWHPYIIAINEEWVAFRFWGLGTVGSMVSEFGSHEALVSMLKQHFSKYYTETTLNCYTITAVFKEERPE